MLLVPDDVEDDDDEVELLLVVVANPKSQFQPNAKVASGMNRDTTSATRNRTDVIVLYSEEIGRAHV